MNIFRDDPIITARVRRGREPSNMEIYESFDDLSLTDTIKEKINHLANAYKCIGEDHYSIRRDLFILSSKRAAKITPSVEQYEDEDESVKLAYKTINEYIHNNNWEMFQEQYMAPILESECDEKIINEKLYTIFKERLAPHLSQRLEGIEYSDKQPYISGAKLEIIFETEELQNLLILSDYLFKNESRKVINDLKEQMYKIKNNEEKHNVHKVAIDIWKKNKNKGWRTIAREAVKQCHPKLKGKKRDDKIDSVRKNLQRKYGEKKRKKDKIFG